MTNENQPFDPAIEQADIDDQTVVNLDETTPVLDATDVQTDVAADTEAPAAAAAGTDVETAIAIDTAPVTEALTVEAIVETEIETVAVDAAVQADALATTEAPTPDAVVDTDEPVEDLYDGPTFEELGLPEKITAALAERGIVNPFPIQAATIPDALSGRDILGRGRTGSGKTLAFGLPTLARLSAGGRTKPGHPRAIILTPTRELAIQVADALQVFGNAVGIDMKVVCGGTAFSRQIDALRSGVDMLVATPGRLRDLIRRGECSLDSVEVAVLDEADQMADMGFLPEVQELFDQLPPGQRMLFSATLEQEVGVLVRKYLSDSVEHSVDPSAGAVTTMTHHLLLIGPRDKQTMTAAVAGRPGLTMVFVRTQLAVDRIADELREAGVNAEGLHGGMSQQDRSKVLDRFKNGRLDALVCTDVAARGIHVDGVDMVLHVDPPKTHKDYLHRAGRTARAGESGTVATLVLPHQNRGVFAMMERAGVEAKRHFVNDNFSPELTELLGARNFTDLRASAAERQTKLNEVEIARIERRVEKLREENERLVQDVVRLREQAERELVEGPSKRGRDKGPRRERQNRDDRGYGGRGERRGGSAGGGGGYGRGREAGRDNDRREGGYRGGRDRDDRARGGYGNRQDGNRQDGDRRGFRDDRGAPRTEGRRFNDDRGGRREFGRDGGDRREGGYRGGSAGGGGGYGRGRDNDRRDAGRDSDRREGGFRGARDNNDDRARGGFRGASDRRERW